MNDIPSRSRSLACGDAYRMRKLFLMLSLFTSATLLISGRQRLPRWEPRMAASQSPVVAPRRPPVHRRQGAVVRRLPAPRQQAVALRGRHPATRHPAVVLPRRRRVLPYPRVEVPACVLRTRSSSRTGLPRTNAHFAQ